ncbi:3-methyl-2-oxobutanoate hydroxymethyltransferase [Dehalococcoidia bacterium]|nr:3-methyl-2-oxobutanoate hydroxymethyltransferase [Dehalococcoidia bacterium]
MRVAINDLLEMKRQGQKVPMLTAYDYTSAQLLEAAGIRLILVGDSLGQVVLGYDSTLPVAMEDMLHHIRAVVRGTQAAHVVGDMPFMSYQAEPSDAVRNAGRIIQEGGSQSVKLEGGKQMAATVARIVESGIPVMGHIGLTPQAINQLGGYKVQGKSIAAAVRLIEDARALEEAGAYAIVLEDVPARLASMITNLVAIPTIGIGAGTGCDGQVQVFHDFLGLYSDFAPKHARRFAELGEAIKGATTDYIACVRDGSFPTGEQSFKISQAVLDELQDKVDQA